MLRSLGTRLRRLTTSPATRQKERPCVGLLDDRCGGWFCSETGQVVDGFSIGRDDTVLDVGCGDDGAGTVRFAADQGAQVIATDIDATAMAGVHKKLEISRARHFETVVSNSNPLPISDRRATRVIAMEVLEHVDDPEQFMSELVRVGRPGARYLLSVPDPNSEALQKKLAPETYWQKPNHLRIFSREDFASLVEESGLCIDKQLFRGFYWAMWWTLFWAAEQEFGEPEGPLLESWSRTWYTLISSPKGRRIKQVLDEHTPKSQVIVATKKAA